MAITPQSPAAGTLSATTLTPVFTSSGVSHIALLNIVVDEMASGLVAIQVYVNNGTIDGAITPQMSLSPGDTFEKRTFPIADGNLIKLQTDQVDVIHWMVFYGTQT